VRTTSAEFESFSEDDELWLSELESRATDLENELSVWREARERALAEDTSRREAAPKPARAASKRSPGRAGPSQRTRPAAPIHTATWGVAEPDQARPTSRKPPPDQRTSALIDHGRRTARQGRISRGRKLTIATAIFAVMVTALLIVVFRPRPSWPPSVAVVQNEITTACQNPNVASEPGQVNFACSKDTSQILWVFSLMTSGNDPNFADPKSGRKGLEPITATQGGELAWSLNLHHPYNPFNPIDSLEVAARAINNIIGGASLTGSNGNPAVQPGLEGNAANCARYTGSSALITRAGYPDICAEPLTSASGEAALVADVYQEWLVGASPLTAEEASILFQNAGDPGNPQVQAILKTLPGGAQ